jgi:hypothetical protein
MEGTGALGMRLGLADMSYVNEDQWPAQNLVAANAPEIVGPRGYQNLVDPASVGVAAHRTWG